MTEARTIYDFNAQRIDGSSASLDEYRGKAILVVNTASKCGFTKQYDGLQKLYLDYKDQGLVILGFPANNFMNQEPGDNSDIADFCR
ncbi:MAG: glutathione peroxidase, partial [Candidatus Cloacimonetes bacterium]|nr:glutathione peroxidase [Candidatus Cloacimonadota bacterium]